MFRKRRLSVDETSFSKRINYGFQLNIDEINDEDRKNDVSIIFDFQSGEFEKITERQACLTSLAPACSSRGSVSHLNESQFDNFKLLQKFVMHCPEPVLLTRLINIFFNPIFVGNEYTYASMQNALDNTCRFIQFGLSNVNELMHPNKEVFAALYALSSSFEKFSFLTFCQSTQLWAQFGLTVSESRPIEFGLNEEDILNNFTTLCSALALHQCSFILMEFTSLHPSLHAPFFSIIKDCLIDLALVNDVTIIDMNETGKMKVNSKDHFIQKDSALIWTRKNDMLKQNAYGLQLRYNLFACRPQTPFVNLTDEPGLTAPLSLG